MQLTALILGFAGSLHCIGMCSPLAIAITSLSKGALVNRILYNAGRIFTYAILGAIVGLSGYILPFTGFQNLISITLGIVLLVTGIAGMGRIHIPVVTSVMQQFSTFLKKTFSDLLQQKNKTAVILLGAVNGLLPCGLTFLALTFCLTLKGPWDGFNFMLLFGAGTLPAMLGFTSLISPVAKRFKFNLNQVATGLMILSGCLLIARVFLNHPTDTSHHAHTLMEIVLCR